MARSAVRDGYSALRILGEATDLKGNESALGRWPGFELRADLLISRAPILAVCAYDSRTCTGAPMELLCSLHASVLGPISRPPQFRLHASPSGGLTLSGEVDLGSAETIAMLASQAACSVTRPILDVRDLSFVDVSGMRAVARTLRAMTSAHPQVRIQGAGRAFRRLWTLMSLDRGLDVSFEPAS